MKTSLSRLISAVVIGLGLASELPAQGQRLPMPQPSPASTLKQRVGFTDIQIEYSRPGVKDRQVFGDLEPYGVVWRTGANSATKITFSTNLKFGGADVPAGTYALFSIPDPNEWTVILNKVTGQWGSYTYDEKNDLVRVKTKPVRLAESVETFLIDINNIRDDSASLNLIWQNTLVPVALQFDVVPTVVQKIQEAMAAERKPSAPVYDQAALFYLAHNLDLNKAAEWIAAAIEQQPKAFYFYYHQALILAKKGDKAAAIAAAKRSIELAAAENPVAKDEYTRLNEKVISSLGQ